MEGLVRLVAESLERHGLTVPAPRIDWSAWTPVDPNLCLTAPCHPGLFIIAEQLVPHTVAANPASQLVVLKVGQTDDIGIEMARLCYHSPLYDRINTGRCLVRFAVVDDAAQRASVFATLLAQSLETSTDSLFPVDRAAKQVPLSHEFPAQAFQNQDSQTEPVLANSVHQPKHPAPLPSDF
jgi:hypothetical protein